MKNKFLNILAAALLMSGGAHAQWVITTVAGNGTGSYCGDGTAAVSSCVSPIWVATDGAGNFYISDEGNERIRMVNSSGIISTIAGNGSTGYSGDGGPAVSAQLNGPTGIVYNSGEVYFSDNHNNVVRMIDLSSGNIFTVAGTGSAGYTSDGVPSTNSELNAPNGLAVDGSGNLYIADYDNARIRVVYTSGYIYTYAGTGVPGYTGDGYAAVSAEIGAPMGLAFDASGSLYFTDNGSNVVRRVDASGNIWTFAYDGASGYSGNGGAATAAAGSELDGIACDGSGNVYIAEGANHIVRYVNSSGIINPYAGNGTAGFSGDGGAATAAELFLPFGIATDPSGNLYIADPFDVRVREVGLHSCIDNSALNISSIHMGGYCSYTATATVSTVNEIVGYQWQGIGGAVFHHNHTSSDQYVFNLTSGSSAVITVTIFVVDTNATDTTSGPCCQAVYTQTVTCGGHGGGGRMDNPSPNQSASGYSIFPNPTDNSITVAANQGNINTIAVFDMQGVKISEYTFDNQPQVMVPLAKLPPGNYLIRINNTTSQIVSKTD